MIQLYRNLCCNFLADHKPGGVRSGNAASGGGGGSETLASCTWGGVFFLQFLLYVFLAVVLPGMPDWHRKMPRQSEELCYPSSDLFCFLVPLPVPVKSVLWADTGRGVRAQVKPFFPVLLEGGIRRPLAYWC